MVSIWKWIAVAMAIVLPMACMAAALPPVTSRPGDSVSISAEAIPLPPCDFVLSAPSNGATLSGGTPVSVNIQVASPPGVNYWVNYYASAPGTSPTSGWKAYGPVTSGSVSIGSLSPGPWVINVVELTGTTPTQVGPPQAATAVTAVSLGPKIAGLDGSASALRGSPDTNIRHYGNYNAPGGSLAGMGLIGGPLLTDLQAAQEVVATQRSDIETNAHCDTPVAPDALPCPHGALNAAANNYFEGFAVRNRSNYLAQLSNFHSAWPAKDWGVIASGSVDRIDGACPLVNPTTAEVLQWAANKWGINPILMYAETSQEGKWDNTELGDVADGIGTSSGLMQVSDRNTASNPSHSFPGFTGISANLARQNSCFNADVYAAHLWATFNGYAPIPGRNIGWAIETWYEGFNAKGPGAYTQAIRNHLISADWRNLYFQGQPVAY